MGQLHVFLVISSAGPKIKCDVITQKKDCRIGPLLLEIIPYVTCTYFIHIKYKLLFLRN